MEVDIAGLDLVIFLEERLQAVLRDQGQGAPSAPEQIIGIGDTVATIAQQLTVMLLRSQGQETSLHCLSPLRRMDNKRANGLWPII
jgi:hypothetical protein